MARSKASLGKREANCLRQRKHQLAKKDERKRLEKELRALQEKLAWISSKRPPGGASRTSSNPFAIATQVIRERAKDLRDEVKNIYKLANLLYYWVASQEPQPDIGCRSSWVEATLVADPVARRQGYAWLSQKAYHTAISAMPYICRPATESVESMLHTIDGDDGLNIAAFSIQLNSPVFANYKHTAKVWFEMIQSADADTVVDKVDDKLYFYRGCSSHNGSVTCVVQSVVEEPDRIVMTAVSVMDDEMYPLCTHQVQLHGFHWTVLERVTESITLMRQFMLQCTPVTADGVVSLAKMGEFVGLSTDGIEHRETYIERFRNALDTRNGEVYRGRMQSFARTLWLDTKATNGSASGCTTGLASLSTYGDVEDMKYKLVNTHDTEDDGGVMVDAIETFVQRTTPGNFKDKATMHWHDGLELMEKDRAQAYDRVTDDLFYYQRVKNDKKTFTYYVVSKFVEETRVVFTFLGVQEDEAHTISDGQSIVPCYTVYVHQTKLYVFDRVSDEVTLFRQLGLTFVSLTTNGPVSLAHVGAMCGLSADGVEHRKAYIRRIEAALNHESQVRGA
ncbi:Aste57867_926 [Aphanomyces stellatus]|uniref:Aste57867_926 protein n=1 Tax=Aphanomyces stellatus TaxID=120398 RepID=A0A485K3W0_9STRA|nr:hypothetical protein As57867_000925 [Aphanomyces stellatus]VFT78150.1 Aste57867_926 [Aphanomyces stellatus]